MDSLTQAVLGAAIGGALMGRWQGRKALLYGAALGTLPDLDVVIDYGDAVANMTMHRGFSHSLLVLTPFSLLLAWLVRRWRPHPGYSGLRLWSCIWLILTTHVLLDAFTTYGTQLFWPLPLQPTAISSIFIIDPLYTLPLLLAVLGGLLLGHSSRTEHWQFLALGLSSLYLLSSLAGRQMALQQLDQALLRDGIQPEQRFVGPTPFNTLLWRVVALDGDQYHEGLVSWFDKQPPHLEQLPNQRSAALQVLADNPQHARLDWFTGGVMRYDLIDNHWVVTDLRLGLPGFHPFRFALAVEEQPLEPPLRWPTPRRDLSGLPDLLRRAINPQHPLSLTDLAADMRQSPASIGVMIGQ